MYPPHWLLTISSAIFNSIFTHLFAGRAEAVCRSLSHCTEIQCKDFKSTTALGQNWDMAEILFKNFLGPNCVSVAESDSTLHVGLEIKMQSCQNDCNTQFCIRQSMQEGLRNYFQNVSIVVILLLF